MIALPSRFVDGESESVLGTAAKAALMTPPSPEQVIIMTS